MTGSQHRPTHSFESSFGQIGEVFNSTQVRLYGIYKALEFPSDGLISIDNFVVGLRRRDHREAEKDDERHDANRRGSEGDSFGGASAIVIDAKGAGTVALLAAGGTTSNCGFSKLSAGVIFSYAYEGHCYDLPKPKIMLIPAMPESPTCDDCGYDRKSECDYRVWVVDKLDRCVEIEVNQGFVEQLVLEANLPGRRSPTTYRATFTVAHRSGRLTD